ncbi:hypothetical protein [Pseudoalteromonas phenolica]|uniref:Uncharacterized protein n=1 Tax=Pseudoalteromonas phenolica TaxID=161398 RepID=A0A0S2K6M3_9GAMM|nr:hypothetical protein [Pseudoalteromonas phenolica]ALO43949.1 hypothetical protein PP2015_3474 [Pseudoalteromonas phenolica]MBE0356922.1 hypothetical protein [Pseudoalteromonas phenolica O-BC30]RXE95371.1 hypothetical protein D9981_15645 [Pseudoalteromonas phenolica O-BC30]TMO54152.1 hypothetical protein CWC21_16385 [Pseudoalteromonas phenolica]
MANEDDFDKTLKHAYQQRKQQQGLTKQDLELMKAKCRQPKQNKFWQQAQWAMACAGLLFLGALWIQPENETTQMYALDLTQYEHIEHHSKEDGQYKVHITRNHTLQNPESIQAKHSELLAQARSFHGRIIDNNTEFLLIADCKENTLLEIEKSLVRDLSDINLEGQLRQGEMLALTSNKKGLLVNLTTLNQNQGIYSCP